MTSSSIGSTVLPFSWRVIASGPRDLELVALAAHRLDQDRQVQLAASAHEEDVGAVGLLDAQRDVGLELAPEPRAKLADW